MVSKEIDLHGDVQSFELFCDVFERIIERVKDLSPHFLSQIKGRFANILYFSVYLSFPNIQNICNVLVKNIFLV